MAASPARWFGYGLPSHLNVESRVHTLSATIVPPAKDSLNPVSFSLSCDRSKLITSSKPFLASPSTFTSYTSAREGLRESVRACAGTFSAAAWIDEEGRVAAVAEERWEGSGGREQGVSEDSSDSEGGGVPSSFSAKERRKQRQARRVSSMEERRLLALDQPESRIAKAPSRTLTEAEFANYRNAGHLQDRGPQWYILNVPAGEARAMERIQEGMERNFPGVEFELFLPLVPSTRVTAMGKLTTTPERVQPGTLFIRVELSTEVHDFLRGTPGVLGFFGRRVAKTRRVVVAPMPVEEVEVENMRRKVREGEAAFEAFKVRFERELKEIAAGERAPIVRRGMKVRVVRGTFNNCEGKVVKVLEDRTKVSLQLKLFEEVQVVEVEVNDLRLPRALVAKAISPRPHP
eukprot:TRINITY_DN24003_c0_g1_i1.p1 TRINITY_DN24003_c0_g1~~TRINITY_DN24003_c0_g1_i1.p1  ORF type:complete len:404 (-),score=78.11 TRINITY_DN24003_c0_g1_i1:410-1621(-)